MEYPHTYLVEIQYLGFRYSGWAKQAGHKTVHGFIDKTLGFVFGHTNFKTLGCSRTDSFVSANQSYFQLFLTFPIDEKSWLASFNSNLPQDIKGLSIKSVPSSFNIIKNVSSKTYQYLFATNTKGHPFTAPFITNYQENPDISLMQLGAAIFVGTHDFRNYCTALNENKKTIKTITDCHISERSFPLGSISSISCYEFNITGSGFLRHQVRLMMAQLMRLGLAEISLEDLRTSLVSTNLTPFKNIAPASGLTLLSVNFQR